MENTLNLKRIWNGTAALFLTLYIFCGHFRYPFSSTLFLYVCFAMTVISLLSKPTFKLSANLLWFFLIVLISFIGLIYTDNLSTAKRQVIFFSVYLVLFAYFIQNDDFLKEIKKTISLFAVLGTFSVFIQFIFTNHFNHLIKMVFRADVYKNVMFANDVDNTFSGLTSSVSMASFSMAIVFFDSVKRIINRLLKDNEDKKEGSIPLLFNIATALISLFGIILTSKRGIFIATVFSLIITIFLDKDISLKKLKPKHILLSFTLFFIVLIILFFLLRNNEFVLAFINRFKGGDITTGRGSIYSKAINELKYKGVLTYLFGNGTGSAVLINETGLHNVYLQIFYDHGLVGTILYLGFFIINLKTAVKNRFFYSMSMQIVFLVYCMSGNPLYDYYFFIPYLIFVNIKK